MRLTLIFLLTATSLLARADDILILRDAPQGCEERGEVSVSSGSKMQGMLFSDETIDNNVKKKLRKAIKKADGNRGVVKDRREFMMESQVRGIEHIELDAWVWHCEEKDAS